MKYDYTFDEIRHMLAWENPQEADTIQTHFTDEVIWRWESAAMSNKNDLQRRVDRWRNRK